MAQSIEIQTSDFHQHSLADGRYGMLRPLCPLAPL